jgi:hypothetical protein
MPTTGFAFEFARFFAMIPLSKVFVNQPHLSLRIIESHENSGEQIGIDGACTGRPHG